MIKLRIFQTVSVATTGASRMLVSTLFALAKAGGLKGAGQKSCRDGEPLHRQVELKGAKPDCRTNKKRSSESRWRTEENDHADQSHAGARRFACRSRRH
jgi:hypothetical protein